MNIKAPPGTFDIIPEDPKDNWHNSYLWEHAEAIFRELSRRFGYEEICTPIFERSELFQHGVGESSDIVLKEMYTFEDKGGRQMALRPEGTAPVLRAFVEHHMHARSPVHKLFYIGPMFRYERAQAGRYRQFHQFGAEAIGNGSPEQDVEMIDLVCSIYKELGLKNLKIYLNSIGDSESRAAFREALKDFLRPSLAQLSEDSQRRFDTNPLRILDSKDPGDQQILSAAPSILDFLNPTSNEHFARVRSLLDDLHLEYEVNPRLVRGLDYYVETVFEIVSGELGAQNSVGGGGRYDGLLKRLGGPDLPCIGFATGIERIILTLLKQEVAVPKPAGPTLFFIGLDSASKNTCFRLLHQIRQAGISAEMDFSGRKLPKIMQYAHAIRAKYVVVVGDNELESGTVELKEMATGNIKKAPLHSLHTILALEQKNAQFLELWNEMSRPFENENEAEFFNKELKKSIDQTKQITENLQSALEKIQSIVK